MKNNTAIPSAIARQLQIDLIADKPNPIKDWFDCLWSKLYLLKTDIYNTYGGEYIYYKLSDHGEKILVFYQDVINNVFWCESDAYWSQLEIIVNDRFLVM